jgi:urease accessory protein
MAFPTLRTLAVAVGVTALAGTAQAHTGHGTHSLMLGLTHPFGFDHLLAMLAVGIWSVSALPARQSWQGPATFLVALLVSGLVARTGIQMPYLEQAIALSVGLFGLMLMTARQAWPKAGGLAVIAAAASLHGMAHGAEGPASGFGGYAVGFMVTTCLLHLAGMAFGLGLQRTLRERSTLALNTLGGVLAGASMLLLGQWAA